MLHFGAEQRRDRVAYRFLADGEVEASQVTYYQQDCLARAIASVLMERRAAGERALLLYPPTLDFISAFLGCLYSGVIAVPLYPPRSERSLPRLAAVAADAQPKLILTTSTSLLTIKAWVSRMPGGRGIEVIATDQIKAEDAGHWARPDINAESIAFLQYTSGSTSTPKGVMVTHGNLLHNEEMISRAFSQSETSIIVSWLPLYHDMGLIGGVLQPLYLGATCILMSPLAFVQKPLRWLQAISKYRATTSGGPNFAYDLCAAKIGQAAKEGLDLSSWSVAFNGSEPVRPDTLRRFSQAFAACGFREEAFYPCYGLAEATLFVSGGTAGSPPHIHAVDPQELTHGRVAVSSGPGGKKFVGCGHAWLGQKVAIVDPGQRTICGEGAIGEIWVSGPSVAQGYWSCPEETSKYFRVPLNHAAGTADHGLFLRTGDLGFLHQEELFITGRIKDLIIVRGRNYYPQDLELTAERTYPGLRSGCSAAFSMESAGDERVVLVQEVESSAPVSELQDVMEKIRGAISQEYELALHEVVLIKAGTIPKTSSGKIQRQACKARYLNAELEVITSNAPAEEAVPERIDSLEELSRERLLVVEPMERRKLLERFITIQASKALHISSRSIGTDQPLSALGLDSLGAVELKHAVEEASGVSLSLARLLEGASTADLAATVASEVEQRSAQEARTTPAATSPVEFPLSSGQRGLWFLQQLAPDNSAYNIVATARARGPLSADTLARAVQALADRHPALRTTFHSGITGEPVQRVHQTIILNLEFVEAESWTEPTVVQRLCQQAWRPFNLERGPLFRIVVLRRAEQEHLLLFAMHHICGDFWSFTVAFHELAELYLQEAGFGAANLPSLEVRYSDYVEHQRRELSGGRGAQLWEYWREALCPPLPDLDLPVDHARPAVQTYAGGTRKLPLDGALSQQLQEISRARGATLYMTLLAAFQVLLHRYSGQPEILTGSPAAGRSTSELAGIIGFFTNPLVMRLKIEDEPTFQEVLERVRRTVLNGLEHQEYPFPLLTERLRPVRDPSRSPLFQAMFILQKAQRAELEALTSLAMGDPETELALGPLTLRPLELPEVQVPFDLMLVMSRGRTGLKASLQYNRDLFEDATAERMLRQFAALLQGIGQNPGQTVHSLPLLSQQDLRELAEWNATESSYPAAALIHELFEAQARRKSQAVAIEDEIRALTYAELDARANQLAHHLQKLGAGPESIVAVCLDRSIELAVALIAILKSGAAYLPLDPGFPESRLRFMLEDAGVQVVLTKAALQAPFENRSVHLLLLDRDWEQGAAESPLKTGSACNAENLAYVIYTSGSTGLPKGVQITHRAVVNFLASMKISPGMQESDVLLSVTTVSFDIFGLEFYLPLISGAKVVLASRETAMDGHKLLGLLKKCRATVMQATPATWQLLLTVKRGVPPIRALCGGDILPPELVKELHAAGCSVWNLYGPTETTIWSSAHEATPAGGCSMTGTAIGRPIANTEIYIFDGHHQPLPAGVPGELVIGGDGVARGYWRRPELTAAKFIPDPLSRKPGARLYRTGDLARLRADGQIEFFGRMDNQVKVRGYRIELGEIESVLSCYPGVQQAVVVARKQSSSDHRLVAYLVPEPGRAAAFEAGELRHFLSERLPEPFVPSHFVTLGKLPLTLNGKVDRRALPDPQPQASAKPEHVQPKSKIERTIGEIWKRVLGREELGVRDNFFDLGGHSLLLAQVQSRLRDAGHNVSMIDLFRRPTIAELARHISAEKPSVTAVETGLESAQKRRDSDQRKSRDIAVIGMAGRFPRAANVQEFWQRISQGEECISFFSDEELEKLGIAKELLQSGSYVKAGGVLEGEDLFDAAFFGYNPREAELMDPQQRLFLECAWHALDDAGHNSEQYPGRIGVFAGAGLNTYLYLAEPTLGQSSSLRYQAFIGNDKDFTATRVSYKLNLKGPGVTVQTACSTSLVAVHLACQSLLNGECEMAMAGAIGVRLSQREGYVYESGGILSADGHCRAFDKEAAGTVFGNGMGVVVLKPLHAAVEDGDNIYAVIKGSAINNDGSLKIGYTAPSVEGQAKVIAEALSISGIEAESVGYIETHGTGTALGDPIEIEALSDAFQAQTGKKGFCAIGSVKTNIGHLDTAAGIAGLIKTICALRYRQLPPSLNFKEPNPKIDFAASPFYVNTQRAEWPKNGSPRRAGVSSFGIGGTNAHMVLEEAPERESSSASPRKWKLLALSAKTPSALEATRNELATALKANQESELSDISYTLQVGRRAFAHRCAVLCQEHSDAVAALQIANGEQVFSESATGEPPEIAFLFPGQGSQYINMGRELYQQEPIFRREVDACAEILNLHLKLDVRQLLFPDEATEAAARELEQTAITQPALFVVEYALARQWMEWGTKPQAMLGHSIGEYVAACLAGVLSLEDALGLVATRGRLMQSMPGGAMLGVKLAETELAPLLPVGVSIAAVNFPVSCVVSGPTEAIGNLEATLEAKEVPFSRLHTSHAFHSSMMEPIVGDFIAAAGKVSLHEPSIPYISNLTGDWVTPTQATDAKYWGQHLRHAVRFGDGIRQLSACKNLIVLECGPGHTLTSLARQENRNIVAVPCLPHAKEQNSDCFTMLRALAKLWVKGAEINWNGFYAHERRRRIPLPPYPFERQRYWINPDAKNRQKEQARTLADWFYVPCWQPSALPSQNDAGVASPILIFEDESGFTSRLADRLQQQGNAVAIVKQGKSFAIGKDKSYVLNPGQKVHYQALFEDLAKSGALPRTIIHAWNITSSGFESGTVASWTEARVRSFDSLMFLAQALESKASGEQVRIVALSNCMQRIGRELAMQPEKAMLLGPLKVIPQEYPNVSCKSIDLLLPEFDGALEDLSDDLLLELSHFEDNQVAYRGSERWTLNFAPMQLPAKSGAVPRLKEKGVYLITGGLGGVGLTFAENLAREVRARLILTARSEFPTKTEWEDWTAKHGEQDGRTKIIRRLQAMEQLGGDVFVVSADVADTEAMQAGLAQAENHFGAIQGVIHAAGVPGGGMIQIKTAELADSVLRPKVQGTLVLHSLLRDRPLDFFLLCSSINSVIGGFGQSDYSAANAFCDAFAQAHFRPRGCYTASINWDRWNEAGMATKAVSMEIPGLPTFLPQATSENGRPHVLLGAPVAVTAGQEVHVAEFSPERQWVLSEHKIAEQPIVPGTTYLEMARAAFAHHAQDQPICIHQAVFPVPLIIQEGKSRNVLTVLSKSGDAFSFRVVSKAQQNEDDGVGWEEHARGEITLANGSGNGRQKHDLAQLLHSFESKRVVSAHGEDRASQQKFIVTGPRWNVLRKVHVAEQQSLAELELDERFAEDLGHYWLHPAVLDVATGFVHFLTEGDFLPLTYEHITIWAHLPKKIFSYLKLRSDLKKAQDVITSDISILDENGWELMRIEGFSMKRVREESVARWQKVAPAAEAVEARLQRKFTGGMSPAQGAEALQRILAQGRSPQIVISTRDLKEVIEEAAALNRVQILNEIETLSSGEPKHARPELASAYTAPGNDMEQRIAAVWQRVLGVDRVGIYDNFFELGGTSLNGVQLVAALKKELNVDVPTVSIFEAPTVAALARYLGAGPDQAVFERAQSRAERKKQALKMNQRVRAGAGRGR